MLHDFRLTQVLKRSKRYIFVHRLDVSGYYYYYYHKIILVVHKTFLKIKEKARASVKPGFHYPS